MLLMVDIVISQKTAILSLKYFWSLLLWNFFKVFDIFQFFLEFLFWRLVVVPAIPIRVVGGCLWLFKNNTGKYHGGCFQTINNHMWKKQHTTTKNVNVAASLPPANTHFISKTLIKIAYTYHQVL